MINGHQMGLGQGPSVISAPMNTTNAQSPYN